MICTILFAKIGETMAQPPSIRVDMAIQVEDFENLTSEILKNCQKENFIFFVQKKSDPNMADI